MDIASTISQLVAIPVGVIIAAFTYFLTKRREREAEWRKEKLKYYQAFTDSLSTITEDISNIKNKSAFCRASNNLMLFAPQEVLTALYEYQETSRAGYVGTQNEHDQKLKALMLAIRKDIGVSPSDRADDFSVRLWAPP